MLGLVNVYCNVWFDLANKILMFEYYKMKTNTISMVVTC